MRRTRLLLAAAALTALAGAAGANVHEDWTAIYDGPAGLDDVGVAIATGPGGSVFVTGKSEDGDAEDDYTTVKYDADGVVEWAARYDGPGAWIDNARDIAVDAFGCACVTGLCWNDTTGFDFATVKYDPDGVEEWVAFYNGPGDCDDYPSVISVDSAGNVYVAGFSCGPGPNPDYVTIKYDSDGNENWAATYAGPRDLVDTVSDIAVDVAGNVYVTGESAGMGTSSDFATIKYSPDGTEEWVARYDGPGHNADSGYALGLDAFGNVYVTGESWSPETEDDIVTVMYDTDGVEKWVSTYDGPLSSDDMSQAIEVDEAGNVRVTGMSRGLDAGFDYVTIAYDAAGDEQWVSRYDGAGGDDLTFALAVDDEGNTYVTGRSWGGVATCYDYATVKYDPAGGESWVARYDGKGNYLDEASDIAIDELGRVCVTGRSWSGASGYDYVTVAYSEGVGTGVDGIVVSAVELHPPHPNPFTSRTTVNFVVPPDARRVRVAVFSAGGRHVKTLVDGPAVRDRCRVDWDGTDERARPVASGVYFVRLEADGRATAEKALLVR